MVNVHNAPLFNLNGLGYFDDFAAGNADDLLNLLQLNNGDVFHNVNLPVDDLNSRHMLEHDLGVGNNDLLVNPLNLRNLNHLVNNLNLVLWNALLNMSRLLLGYLFHNILIYRDLHIPHVLLGRQVLLVDYSCRYGSLFNFSCTFWKRDLL